MAVVIQRKWPKLEGSSEELGDTMVELLDAMRRKKEGGRRNNHRVLDLLKGKCERDKSNTENKKNKPQRMMGQW